MNPIPTELLPGVYRFDDTCNVYAITNGRGTIAIDFGSGRWLSALRRLKLPPLEHVFITHHHADQCEGLLARDDWPFAIHAPAGEKAMLEPAAVDEFWRTRRAGGVPRSYLPLRRGLPAATFDMAGWTDLFWGQARLRFIDTPGHGTGAVSVLLDADGRQVVFCGDAAHAGSTIWQPYHLEWDHWTGSGALLAWEGVQRLLGIGIDLLCPSHGPVVTQRIRPMLRTLAARLLALYRAKGSICAGERDYYLPPRILQCGAREVLPGLYQFAANSYLLRSACGDAMVIDPTRADIALLEPLLAELGDPAVTAATASHFHLDHTDGLPLLKARHGTAIHLHPQVAEPIREIGAIDAPWLPAEPIVADHLLPRDGTWTWNEYRFRCAPLPGQTWWHCALMTTIAGRRVLFAGDNFQPPSRWNGTGGFSSFNGSVFEEGFVESARRIIDWRPDVVATGHGTYVLYNERYYLKVIRWARAAQAAVKALCPSGKLERDYYLHKLPRRTK